MAWPSSFDLDTDTSDNFPNFSLDQGGSDSNLLPYLDVNDALLRLGAQPTIYLDPNSLELLRTVPTESAPRPTTTPTRGRIAAGPQLTQLDGAGNSGTSYPVYASAAHTTVGSSATALATQPHHARVQGMNPCPACTSAFVRAADLERHYKSKHIKERHFCPLGDCPKSQGTKFDGYSRPDKVAEHLWRKHAALGYTKRCKRGHKLSDLQLNSLVAQVSSSHN